MQLDQTTTDDLAKPEEANAMTFRMPDDKPRARRPRKTDTTPTQTTLMAAVALTDAQHERAADRTAELRELLGSAAPKQYERVWVFFDQVDVEGIEEEALVEDAAAMKSSADALGIMSDPVAEHALNNERWQIVAGRRRFLTQQLQANDLPASGMRMEGDPKVGCYVMTPIGGYTGFESALATIVENNNRRAAWIRDVAKVRMLESRGFLEPVIIRLLVLGTGKNANEVKPLVKMAFLPYAFVKLILAGRMTQKTAKMLCGLPKNVLDTLEVKAKLDEAITAEDIQAAKQVGATDTFAKALDFVGDIPVDEPEAEAAFDIKTEVIGISGFLNRVRKSNHPKKNAIATMLNAVIVELSRTK